MNVTLRTGVLAAAVLCSACATTGSVRTAPLSEGVSRTFHRPYAQVMAAARTSMVEAGLAIEEVSTLDDSTSMLLGRMGQSAVSHGEFVRLLVRQTAPDATVVRVYTRKKMATDILAKGDYSGQMFSLIETRLNAEAPPSY